MPLTEDDLKSTLWDAANTLRDSAVDRTDWKGYIPTAAGNSEQWVYSSGNVYLEDGVVTAIQASR
jgi:hypothetical protein